MRRCEVLCVHESLSVLLITPTRYPPPPQWLLDSAAAVLVGLDALKAVPAAPDAHDAKSVASASKGTVLNVTRNSEASVSVDFSEELDVRDVPIEVEPEAAAAPEPEPLAPGTARIGHSITSWNGTVAVAKPVLILPYAAPCAGRVTSVQLKLSPNRRNVGGDDVCWFLMVFEINGTSAIIWSGRSLDVDTSLVNVVQEIDISDSVGHLNAGHYVGLVCTGADVGLACEDTPGGACAYTMRTSPDFFTQVGERLTINRDGKVCVPLVSVLFCATCDCCHCCV